MVTMAVPVALVPASGHGGVSFAEERVRLNTFGWPVDEPLPQATTIATVARNTVNRTRFIAASRMHRGESPDLIPATRGPGCVAAPSKGSSRERRGPDLRLAQVGSTVNPLERSARSAHPAARSGRRPMKRFLVLYES